MGLRRSGVERRRHSPDNGQLAGAHPHYQVGIKIQTYSLGDYNSVVHKIKGFSKVYKSKSKRGVTFVQVAVCTIK